MGGRMGASPYLWADGPGCRPAGGYRYVGTSGLEGGDVSMRINVCIDAYTQAYTQANIQMYTYVYTKVTQGGCTRWYVGRHPGGHPGVDNRVHRCAPRCGQGCPSRRTYGDPPGYIWVYQCAYGHRCGGTSVHPGGKVQTDRYTQVGKWVWKQGNMGTDAGISGKMWKCLGENREQIENK